MLIWMYHKCCYGFGSLIIIITNYYYEVRLNQLDFYVNSYLKRKKFKQINQITAKLLADYAEIVSQMNQLNKFISKLIFCMLLFCSSTLVFLILNIIYVKMDLLIYILYIIFAADIAFVISMVLISIIRVSSKIYRNKRNLIALIYVKNMQTKNRIKVSC